LPLPDVCSDCLTPVGGVHHPGCCVERCPACLGQALGCPCFAELEEEEEEERARVRSRARRCSLHLFRQASRG